MDLSLWVVKELVHMGAVSAVPRPPPTPGDESDDLIAWQRTATSGEVNQKIMRPKKGHAIIRPLAGFSLRPGLPLGREFLRWQQSGHGLARRELAVPNGSEELIGSRESRARKHGRHRFRLEDLGRALSHPSQLFLQKISS